MNRVFVDVGALSLAREFHQFGVNESDGQAQGANKIRLPRPDDVHDGMQALRKR